MDTKEMRVAYAAGRILSDRIAASCNVDCGDQWKIYGNDCIDDAKAMLQGCGVLEILKTAQALIDELDAALPHNMKHIAAGQRANLRIALSTATEER